MKSLVLQERHSNMVDIVLKLTAPEVSVTTPNTVNDCVLFRIYTPSGGADAVITVKDSANTVIGSMTQPAGFVEIMEKRPSDTVESTVAIKCTPVAYK
jgi:hypothetical protein